MSQVLLTSGSGHIGSELVPLLLSSPSITYVVLPTSNASKFSPSVSQSPKTTIVEGSIQDPQWIDHLLASHAIDTVFLNLTGKDELFTTLNFINSLQRSPRVKHLVYLSACGDPLNPNLRGCLAAHVLVKILIEQVLRAARGKEEGGFSWTVIGPTLFMENDFRALGEMRERGFYSEPIGEKGCSRVAVKDIASGVAKAIEDQGKVWDQRKVMIGSKRMYTESDICSMWGEALGKPIRMQKADEEGLAGVENRMRNVMDPAYGRDFRLMYETLVTSGFGMTDEMYEEQKQLLGREPSSYEDFIKTNATQKKEEVIDLPR